MRLSIIVIRLQVLLMVKSITQSFVLVGLIDKSFLRLFNSFFHRELLQFEIELSASTMGVSMCFILPAGRHAMLLQCANMSAEIGHSNVTEIQNTI